MAVRRTPKAWIIGLGVLLIAIAVPAVVGGAAGIGSGTAQPSVLAPSEQVMDAAVPDPGAAQAIEGTDLTVPVPDRAIGSEIKELEIPLQESDVVVHGVAFYRPGPISGSLVGGVSVVYDDSSTVRSSDGTLADADTIAKVVNPDLEPEVLTIGERTVLAWPDSERVPSEWIPQQDRSVSRYVVLLDDGILMVTFDDVDPKLAEGYLAVLGGAK